MNAPSSDRAIFARLATWRNLAILSWSCAIIAMGARTLDNLRVTTITTYLLAGSHWLSGAPIYTSKTGMGFVYSPLVAACFAGLSLFPEWLGKLAWLLLNVALLLFGVILAIRHGPFRSAFKQQTAMVLAALLPLSFASLDVAQANAALIGLLLLAVTAASVERWTLCVLLIALAGYLKIYPLVLGLLFCVLQPRQVIWRFLAAISGLGLANFLLQRPGYVAMQYHGWFATRFSDDRLAYSMRHAPLDLWYLLVRLGHLPLSENGYRALQVLCGGAIAIFCGLSSRWGWTREKRLAGTFLLCCLWIILLGPATESYTYAILAPAISLGLVAAFLFNTVLWMRLLATSAFALLLLAQVRSSFFHTWGGASILALRPLAALVFLVYVLAWLRSDDMWPVATAGERTG